MRILAVGAHPDDIELQCAGTLARFIQRGDQVTIAVSTDGCAGTNTVSSEEIARIRQAEARASAKVLGAEFIWMGYQDEFLYESKEVRLRYIDLVRQTRPDVIITHDPQTDYHPDHLTTGQLIWNIKVMAPAVTIKTEHPPFDKIPEIYFMDNLAGIQFQPDDYVDISSTIDIKRKMLEQHASQIEFMKSRYGMTMVGFMEVCSGFRGLQAGVRFAECFRRSVTYPTSYRRVLP